LAEAPSLEGCITHGDTPEEALNNARDAVLSWLDMSISQGLPIPESGSKEYSGSFNVRLSKSLHAQLARRAKKEGVSLNHLISQFLAQSLERKRA
jgi:antitoxin HicB